MATGGYTKKNTNFQRLGTFLLDVGTPVLRKLLECKALSNAGINTVSDFLRLDKCRQTLLRLNSREHVIRKHQFEMIYPKNGASADIETWDISLLSVVLKNTCNLSAVEHQLVEKLRVLRNSIYGHVSQAKMEDADFERSWADIESTITDLLAQINRPDFTAAMKANMIRIKEDPLEAVECYTLLQDQLIKRYESFQSVMPVSPMCSDKAVSIDMYTDVVLHDVTRQCRDNYYIKDEDRGIESYHDIFHHEDEPVEQIVITGAAGRGKTSFCLKMISVWCSAMRKQRTDNNILSENEKQMQAFHLVFYISMRVASHIEAILDMIKNQLFEELPNKYMPGVEGCFADSSTRCLILLDGLDEWNYHLYAPKQLLPGKTCQPGRRLLNSCPTIITTRPWKLDSLPRNVKQRVHAIGALNEESIRTLARKVLLNHCHVKDNLVEGTVNSFIHELKDKSLSLLAEVPIVLTYLVCLWKDGYGLEESRTVNYGGLLDRILCQNDNCNSCGKSISVGKTKQSKVCCNLPKCLLFYKHIVNFGPLLCKLGSFAYDCLTASSDLVYDKHSLEGVLGKEDLNTCLKIGLLSHSQVPCTVEKGEKVMIQFFHKSIQEFLAALWVTSTKSGVDPEKFIPTLDKVLDMSNVVIFICGMNPALQATCLRYILKLSTRSDTIHTFRHSLDGKYNFFGCKTSTYRTVKQLQELIQQCFREYQLNIRYGGNVAGVIKTQFDVLFFASVDIPYRIHDVIITERTAEETVKLISQHTKELKSLYVDCPSKENRHHLIRIIPKTESLERLHMDKTCSPALLHLKPKQLRQLYSLSVSLEKLEVLPKQFDQMQNISALSINITASHKAITQLSEYFSKTSRLQELELDGVTCLNLRESSSHKCDYTLDLSNNRRLRRLCINYIKASSVDINSEQLESVKVSEKTNNPSSIFTKLSHSGQLTRLTLGDRVMPGNFVWNRYDVEMLVNAIPFLHNLVDLQLLGINFRDLFPEISPNANCLESLSIEMVRMHGDGWRHFVQSLITVGKHIDVRLISTDIDEHSIAAIHNSEGFRNIVISR